MSAPEHLVPSHADTNVVNAGRSGCGFTVVGERQALLPDT